MVGALRKFFLFLLFILIFPVLSFAVPVQFLLSGFTDNSGEPLNGGKVYAYSAGTLTPKNLYTDEGLTAGINPVTLDSNGRAQVYAGGSYKLIIKTSADVTLYTFDNLNFDISVGTSDIEDDSVTLIKIKSTDRDGNARADLATIAKLQDGGVHWLGTTGGSANAQTATATPTITAYAAGQRFFFIPGFANTTTTPTLNIDGVGAKTMLRPDGNALSFGDLTNAGAFGAFEAVYDGQSFRLMNINPVVNSYTPTVSASTGSLSATTYTANFQRLPGRRVFYTLTLTFTMSGGAGAGVETVTFSLPGTSTASTTPCLAYETGAPPKTTTTGCALTSTTQGTIYQDTGITNATHTFVIQGNYVETT